MKRSYWIVGAWLLLLIPTLLIGALALRLLRNEQGRLAENTVSAARQRCASIAESLDLTVAEVKDGLLTSLRQLPADDLEQHLEDWRLGNPLVRNVFIWSPDGLQLPDPATPADSEAGAFVARYLTLFNGRSSWRPPQPDHPRRVTGSQDSYATAPGKTALSSRKELRLLAQQLGSAPQMLPESGWLSWFWEDGLYLLGWLEDPASGQRYGLEVEMMALLARLVTSLPEPPSGEIYALVDGQGRIFHRTGTGELTADTPQLASLPVGPDLPHWQLTIYVPGGMAAGHADGGLLLLSTLLVGCFVAAVLFGGSLLLWQAWRHMRDARRKTSFVSNVSHELKTPLTTIRMYAELLGEGRIREEGKRQRYLQVIVSESQRLTRLVNNVLDFSRLEQKRKQYHLTALPLTEILQQVLDGQNLRLQQAGLELVRRMPDSGPPVQADRDAVEQVLLNLIDNAIKYAVQGGELVVELRYTAKTAEILIKDRGPGVPAAHRQRIFNQFHQVDTELSSQQSGCGLGLSIARRLLQDMQGSLRYCPRDGGGACFVMALPVAGEDHR
ncbi:sensor histidine kinase [Syntrophotalea carbinolica DSM 2380]|uniref:histidine kinase n=1 Tax=Syntrophotalea carbinolica (strain DSM 2380 / NBRC 103641 / GraBd1) TaxID=338963 RepID=Q3A189_SYNC1|nr:HAMP domain-containing sensor histidine kinase [Syntrophotalea carbinolica]ABA89868.1 sensor histidine kinase [Syntrophotalea carbinolica DSM 2380]